MCRMWLSKHMCHSKLMWLSKHMCHSWSTYDRKLCVLWKARAFENYVTFEKYVVLRKIGNLSKAVVIWCVIRAKIYILKIAYMFETMHNFYVNLFWNRTHFWNDIEFLRDKIYFATHQNGYLEIAGCEIENPKYP